MSFEGEYTAYEGDYSSRRTDPEWGVLMGIKPLKLYSAVIRELGSPDSADSVMSSKYRLSEDKIALLHETWDTQREEMASPGLHAIGLYIGIPFCPSRCAYCSFTMEEAAAPSAETLKDYMDALFREMKFVAENMEASGMRAESIYIGGGTPTALDGDGLARLLGYLRERMPGGDGAELSLEAGRPDTVNAENSAIMASFKTDRVCVNPQSMNPETLDRIGRRHGPEAVLSAYEAVREAGIPVVNMDVIAGLPGESADDFARTMNKVWEMSPENVSVHILSLKRGSRLWEDRESGNERIENGLYADGRARAMIGGMRGMMKGHGYRPYYLYRQKYILDNLENVAYAKPGTACLYNMRIMEERQTIIAMGAGGGSKVWYPREEKLRRVYNVSNHEVYIERIDDMIERKRKGIFSDRRLVC